MGDLALVLMFLAFVLWSGRPFTLWALVAGALTWAVRLAVKRKVAPAGAEALVGALGGITVGLGLVWLCQIALLGVGSFASDVTVRDAQASMAAAHASLSRWTHLETFLSLIAVSLLLHWLGKMPTPARVVALVASVLFFGGEAARLGEERWVESRRIEASADLRALRAAQTRLVAVAEVRQRIAELSPEDREYLASFLRATESKKHRAEILAEKAERLAAGTSAPQPPPPAGPAGAEWAAVERCEAWSSTTSPASESPGPSLADLATMGRVSRELAGHEAEALASTGAFESAVAEAAARRWAPAAWGSSVQDLASAERLVAAEERPRDPWPLATTPDRPDGAATEVEASELALDALDRETPTPEWSNP